MRALTREEALEEVLTILSEVIESDYAREDVAEDIIDLFYPVLIVP
jgi:hypothetical protein